MLPVLGILFNIPGWVFQVGLVVLVRRAQGLGLGSRAGHLMAVRGRHQTHILVQSAFFPINKTWSSGATIFFL